MDTIPPAEPANAWIKESLDILNRLVGEWSVEQVEKRCRCPLRFGIRRTERGKRQALCPIFGETPVTAW